MKHLSERFHLEILELSERREGSKTAVGRLKERAESIRIAGLHMEKNIGLEIWRNSYILEETKQEVQIGKQWPTQLIKISPWIIASSPQIIYVISGRFTSFH